VRGGRGGGGGRESWRRGGICIRWEVVILLVRG